MTLAMIVFFASFALIIGLFALRSYEEKHGGKIAPTLRESADNAALEVKDWVEHTRDHLEALPPEVAHLGMRLTHASALAAASLARSFERQAHRFADFVSTKRNFERRETKSEFLQQVSEYRSPSAEDDSQENFS